MVKNFTHSQEVYMLKMYLDLFTACNSAWFCFTPYGVLFYSKDVGNKLLDHHETDAVLMFMSTSEIK